MRRRPTRIEKKLLEELLPICAYVQASYRPGRYMSVRWMDGSQNFDAELHQRGAYVLEHYYPAKGFIEVTCTMHSKEHLMRELLDTKGTAFGLEGIRRMKNGDIESTPVAYSYPEFIDDYAAIVLEQIAQKARVHYPANTTLIVQCTLNTIYMPNEWGDLISRIRTGLPTNNFREIYLYDPNGRYSQSLFPR